RELRRRGGVGEGTDPQAVRGMHDLVERRRHVSARNAARTATSNRRPTNTMPTASATAMHQVGQTNEVVDAMSSDESMATTATAPMTQAHRLAGPASHPEIHTPVSRWYARARNMT